LSVFQVLGQHPDGGPEPIAGGVAGTDLDFAVFEGERVDSPEPGAGDGVDEVGAATSS